MRFLTAIICLVIALNCAAQVNGLFLAKSVGSPLARIAGSRQLTTNSQTTRSTLPRTTPAATPAAKKTTTTPAAKKTTTTPAKTQRIGESRTGLKPEAVVTTNTTESTSIGNSSSTETPTGHSAAKRSSFP